MNQKVVFLDVDGTIVNDKGIIPESTKTAIRKAVENGHKLVVCSGRSLFQLPQMLLNLGFSGSIARLERKCKEISRAAVPILEKRGVRNGENRELHFPRKSCSGIIIRLRGRG